MIAARRPFNSALFRFQKGSAFWNNVDAPDGVFFPWDAKSTYIRCPPFFNKLVSHFSVSGPDAAFAGKNRTPELFCPVSFPPLRVKIFILPGPLITHTSCCFWATKSPPITSPLPAASLGSAPPPSTYRANGICIQLILKKLRDDWPRQ